MSGKSAVESPLNDALAVIDVMIDRQTLTGASFVRGTIFRAIEAEAATPSTPGLDVERLAEIVSDSLAATTEGTEWAEAPQPSDEPGSPYVLRLTNEIYARLTSTEGEPKPRTHDLADWQDEPGGIDDILTVFSRRDYQEPTS